MADAGTTAAFCPTSNLFLVSSLVPLNQLPERDSSLSLESDVDGGTSFSMPQTMHEMYKVIQLGNDYVDHFDLF